MPVVTAALRRVPPFENTDFELAPVTDHTLPTREVKGLAYLRDREHRSCGGPPVRLRFKLETSGRRAFAQRCEPQPHHGQLL